MILHHRHFPCAAAEPGTPLLILHGLYGNSGNWASQARVLAQHREVFALDARNHGLSPHSETMDFPAMAADVAETMTAFGLQQVDLLGHSMGGKAAMQLALQQPGRVRRLVVADIAPVAYPRGDVNVLEGLCAIKPEKLASREDADAVLEAYVREKRVRDFLLANLQKEADGGFRWRFNLPVIRSAFRDIIGWPESDAQFGGPVLFIKGATSDYILAEHRDAILQHFPQARSKVVAGAGHWVHSEKPETFLKLVEDFLAAP